MDQGSRIAQLLAGVGVAALAAAPVVAQAESLAEAHAFHEDHVLGTSLDMTAVADSHASALMAATAARAEIERLDAVLSTWRADSEISALNASAPAQASAKVSGDLMAVLNACEAWRARTGGAYDCRLGKVQDAWRAAEAQGRLPDAAQLAALAKAADRPVGLDLDAGTVVRPEGVAFAVDGLAKGYVIDQALAAARKAAPGLQGMLIDIGGDMKCFGRSPQAGGWTVGVADPANLADNAAPAAMIRISDMAVASSGRGARDLTIGGCAYGHTLDPASGQSTDALGAAQTVSATVVAPKAAAADALATAFSVMAPEKALELANRYPGVEALLVDAAGATHQSDGWSAISCQASEAWPAGFQVTVNYVVPKKNVTPYKAPFVYMWITDSDKNVVRTLLLLGNQGRWMQENYLYWRRVGRRNPEKAQSIARPSRQPGAYSVTWDGKDDAGKQLPQGTYTLNVESAREHGDHSFQTVELKLGADGITGQAASVAELGALQVKYGK